MTPCSWLRLVVYYPSKTCMKRIFLRREHLQKKPSLQPTTNKTKQFSWRMYRLVAKNWRNWSMPFQPFCSFRREMQQTPYDESKEGVIRAPDYVPQLHLVAVARPWEIHNGRYFLRSAGITPLTLISRSSLWVQSRVVGHHFFFGRNQGFAHFFGFIRFIYWRTWSGEALWQDLRLCSWFDWLHSVTWLLEMPWQMENCEGFLFEGWCACPAWRSSTTKPQW